MAHEPSHPSMETTGRFGAFGGVFTPSILTILGVVMYLRVGWVVGHAGLAGALIIVVISHLISMTTGLSISSIATNKKVGVGGAYFMISRTLGASAGGAIGIPLYFAQALSVTFYVVGFSETLSNLVPWISPQLLGTFTLVVLTLLSLKSADLAIKTQYVVMAAIVLSLGALFTGSETILLQLQAVSLGDDSVGSTSIQWWGSGDEPFSKVFAIFFPAVTGIMAGVSMSGDLKNPRSALPIGTMWAVLVGFVIYIAITITMALTISPAVLRDNLRVVWKMSSVPQLIYLGVWGATLSSALGSLLAAPRTLQALSQDGLTPKFLGKGSGPQNEPRNGTISTFFLALAGVWLGSLDAIAPILTMFFLATYGMTNLVCAFERWTNNPSFRPTFSVHTTVSLAGAIACFYVMSVINILAMVGALFICMVIFISVERRRLDVAYGDTRHGFYSAMVSAALQRMRRVDYHHSNWRPNLLVMGGEIEKRPQLIELGSAIVHDRGIVTYLGCLTGEIAELATVRDEKEREFDKRLSEAYPNVFCRVQVTQDLYRGLVTASQCYGVGDLHSNTLLLGWQRRPEKASHYFSMLNDLVALDRSIFMLDYKTSTGFGRRKRIDIWWRGLQENGGKMLIVADMLSRNAQWRDADVRVVTVVSTDQQRIEAEQNLQRILSSARMDTKAAVVMRNGREIIEIMREQSASADLALIGAHIGETDDAKTFFQRHDRLLDALPTTLLVHSARHFDSGNVLFDSHHPKETT